MSDQSGDYLVELNDGSVKELGYQANSLSAEMIAKGRYGMSNVKRVALDQSEEYKELLSKLMELQLKERAERR